MNFRPRKAHERRQKGCCGLGDELLFILRGRGVSALSKQRPRPCLLLFFSSFFLVRSCARVQEKNSPKFRLLESLEGVLGAQNEPEPLIHPLIHLPPRPPEGAGEFCTFLSPTPQYLKKATVSHARTTADDACSVYSLLTSSPIFYSVPVSK